MLSRLLAFILSLLLLVAPAQAEPTTAQEIGSAIGERLYDFVHQDDAGVPWLQKQGPPYKLAIQSGAYPGYTARQGCTFLSLFTGGGVYANSGCGNQTSFDAPLQASLVPVRALGDFTPTFTRATTAYQTDFEGKLNLLPSGAARMQGARYVRNLIPAAGTGSASLAAAANKTVTVGVGTFVFSMGAVAAANTVITFTGTATGLPGATLTANATKRTSVAMTITVGGTVIMTASVAGAVDLQFEDTTGQTNQNPSEYVSVGVESVPYHGAGVDGVKYFPTLNGNTVASNVVTEATGAAISSSEAACAGGVTAGVVDASGPLGYLAEGARTNLALQSQTFGTTWVPSNLTVGAKTTAPDGTATADTLTSTAGNGLIFQSQTRASLAYTFSVWLKRNSGSGDISVSIDGGATYVVKAVSAAWTRFDLTQTLANPSMVIKLTTSGDSIFAWGAQLEAASFASTYIPTTTVAVTRNADIDAYASAGNISATALSMTMEITPTVDLGSTTVFHWASYVDADNYTALLSDGTNLIARKRIGGSNHDATIAWARAEGTTIHAFARFDTTNGVDVGYDGTLGTPDTTTTASQIGAAFQFGTDGNGANQDYCEHRFFVAYPTALSASRLQAMTTAAFGAGPVYADLSDSRFMLAADDRLRYLASSTTR